MLFDFLRFYSKYGLVLLVSSVLLVAAAAFVGAYYSIIDYSWFIISLICIVCLLVTVVVLKKYCNCDLYSLNLNVMSSLVFGKRAFRVFCIVYVICMAYVLILSQFIPERDIVYFSVLLIVLSSILMCVFLQNSFISHIIVISQSICFSIFISAIFFKFFYWSSYDTFAHAIFNKYIYLEGSFDYIVGAGVTKEMSYPLQHIFIAICSNILGLDIRLSTIIPIILAGVVLSLSVYCISRYFMPRGVSVISILLYNVMAYIIYFRVMGVTTTYASMLFLVLILLIFKLVFMQIPKKQCSLIWALSLSVALCITLSHLFSFLIVFMTFVGVCVAAYVLNQKIFKHFIIFIFLYLVSCCSYLLYVNWGFTNIIVTITKSMSLSSSALSGSTFSIVDAYIGVDTPNLLELILRMFPLTLLIIVLPLILMSCYMYFRSGSSTWRIMKLWYILIPYFILTLFTGFICIINTEMSGRIFLYLIVFYSISLCYVFNSISTYSNGKFSAYLHYMLIILVIVGICFFNLAHPTLNSENLFWNADKKITSHPTTLEISGLSNCLSLVPSNKINEVHIDASLSRVSMYYLNAVYYNSSSLFSPMLFSSSPILNTSNVLDGEYVLYNSKLSREPTRVTLKQGDISQYVMVKLDTSYQSKLSSNRCLIYSNIQMKLYM